MPQNESSLFVPLRSNASTLLTGAPIAAMRRRLKFASLFYDRLLLEAGVLTVQVGRHGGSSMVSFAPGREGQRWQTPRARHAAEERPFQLAMGRESVPGVLAETMHTIVASETTICWIATLHPFADELPTGADWVDFIRTGEPTGEAGRLAQGWTWDDQRNPSLERAIPVRFVRGTVIKNANRDLVGALAQGTAIAVDPVHLQVVAQRFRDDERWRLRGYSVPIIVPQVGDLPWAAIADLRGDQSIARFRAVLREVEEEATAEAAGGDIEAAAHHVYERHLAEANGRLEGAGGPARRAVAGFVIGGAGGFATSGITGPAGIVAGAAVGTALTTIVDVRKMIHQRRSKSWVALYQSIAAKPGQSRVR